MIRLRASIPTADGRRVRTFVPRLRAARQSMMEAFYRSVTKSKKIGGWLVDRYVDAQVKAMTGGKPLWEDSDKISDAETLEFGRSLWGVMSNNRLWKGPDGLFYSLGSFRAAGGMIADVFGGVYVQYAWTYGDGLYSADIERLLADWGFVEEPSIESARDFSKKDNEWPGAGGDAE